MLANVALGGLLVVLTAVIHAACMVAAIRLLRGARSDRWTRGIYSLRPVVVCTVVLIMFMAGVVEAALWAWTYLLIGALADLPTALYFSMVTFTTLGYGDIVLDERWRLLSSFQAAAGIMMFGWTTALVFATVQRVYLAAPGGDDPPARA